MGGHVHKEMIKAKADNMTLAVFFKSNEYSEWRKIIESNELPAFYEHYEYFLCHPKHEGVCLHWLNEVDVQNGVLGEFIDFESKICYGNWRSNCEFMNCNVNFRIKPRKEKRWIAVKEGKVMSNHLFESENEARVICGCVGHDAQFIEIEAVV